MKKLMLSTILVTATAGFAMAQDATTTPPPATEAPATEAPAMDAPAMTEPTTAPTMGTETAPAADATESSREGYSPMMTEALTSETLEGARVYSSDDEWVGSISELVMDDTGQISEVIVDVGGFLGIGKKPVALTMSELELLQETDGDDVRAYAPMSKDQLEALPTYEG